VLHLLVRLGTGGGLRRLLAVAVLGKVRRLGGVRLLLAVLGKVRRLGGVHVHRGSLGSCTPTEGAR
jgi:hypothetical protein